MMEKLYFYLGIWKLKEQYKEWRDQRFLKKNHCKTWYEYNRRFSPDVCYRSTDIKNFYLGYPFVHCIESNEHFAYKLIYDYGPGGYRYGYKDILDWCKENSQGKYRADIHRVMKNTWSGRWVINELGGADYVFFAFNESKDYVNFLLRWS